MAFDYASKIQALLAKAERTDNDHEAQVYRDKADELMKAYRIAEEDAIASDPGSVLPISRDVVIKTYRDGTVNYDLDHYYTMVFSTIARHTGVRYAIRYEDRQTVATVVGYEGDIRYSEFLWTAAYLMFSTRIDPIWDHNRSDEENIFLLRNAGIERRVIADKAWGNGGQAAARSRVQRIYLREAARRGEDARAAGLGFDTTTYRLAYADSFHMTLARRLRIARDAANSVGGGLVLHGRSERVDEAFYGLFPIYRPSTEPAAKPPVCGDCTDGKLCKIHKPRAWTKADEAAYQRRTNSPSARAGASSGQSAAEGVVVTRGHTTASRLDASGRALEG